jgi:hypothetical protein
MPPLLELDDDDDPLLEPDDDEDPPLEPDESPLVASPAASLGIIASSPPLELELEEPELLEPELLELEPLEDATPDELLPLDPPLEDVDMVPSLASSPLPGLPLLPPHPATIENDTPTHTTRHVRSCVMVRTSTQVVYLNSRGGPPKSGCSAGSRPGGAITLRASRARKSRPTRSLEERRGRRASRCDRAAAPGTSCRASGSA